MTITYSTATVDHGGFGEILLGQHETLSKLALKCTTRKNKDNERVRDSRTILPRLTLTLIPEVQSREIKLDVSGSSARPPVLRRVYDQW